MRFSRLVILATAAFTVSGCATHKYVDRSVADLESRQSARMDQLDKTSKDALDRAIAAGKLAEGKFMYNVVLSDDAVKFDFGKAKLSPEAEARLTQLADQLKSENKNVYLEIQGHTDSTGPEELNRELGQKRAEAVRLFLNKQGVALNRMATISYGEDAPVAPNSDKAGRAQNRRVVIVVLN